jgi:hypothetical protein
VLPGCLYFFGAAPIDHPASDKKQGNGVSLMHRGIITRLAMRSSITLITTMFFGMILLSNGYGCKKQPVTGTPPPIDSPGTKVTASKKRIDSLIGIYCGRRESHDTFFSSGIPGIYTNYSGPDTVDVIRGAGTDLIELLPKRAHGLYPTIFIFDTTGVLHPWEKGAALYVFPEQDSISYVYHGYSGTGYQITGYTFNSTFVGKK